MKAPKAIDCFCGAGGFSLGLQQAGYEIAYAFDNNRIATETYRKNLGNHVLETDAQTVSGIDLRSKFGEITLVAGGPPCQGFSVQRRGGEKDERKDLIFEFLRLVIEIEPLYFVMENVSALAGPRNKHYLDRLLCSAQEAGYQTVWKVLDASNFGVPQKRKRLFVVGSRRGKFTFPAPTTLETRTVADAFSGLPEPGSAAARNYFNHDPDNISALNRERISHVPEGGGRENIPPHLQLPCHSVAVDKAGHRGVYGRLTWGKPSGTITTKCNSFTRGRFAHPVQDRNITMREAARLQSFPDHFQFLGGKVDVAHQVGNAVPPPLAKAIAEAILRHSMSPPVKHDQSQLELIP